jgi:uncharacterized protein (TIGR03067 family)
MKGFVLLAASLVVGADKPAAGVKQELKKFQGDWVAVAIEVNGRQAPEQLVKSLRVTFKGNQVTIKEGRRVSEATFTIKPTKKPPRIDGTSKAGEKEIETIGIYEFDGDRLTICYTLAGGKRPQKFSTKGGTEKSPLFMAVYQRPKQDQ